MKIQTRFLRHIKSTAHQVLELHSELSADPDSAITCCQPGIEHTNIGIASQIACGLLSSGRGRIVIELTDQSYMEAKAQV
jgi:hypothetical protein